MTDYTNQMKMASSLAKKIKIVEKLSDEGRFTDINKQYLEMKVAKKMLSARLKKINNDTAVVTTPSYLTKYGEMVKVERGTELKVIDAWNDSYDEIEELKKVFFEFLKRWVEIDGSQTNVNQPTLYKRYGREKFSLELDFAEAAKDADSIMEEKKESRIEENVDSDELER